MSDYLGSLAARSLDPAPAVRPRLASRFEPVAPALPAFQAEREPEAFATAVEETAVAPAPPRPALASRERMAPPEPVEEEPPAPPRRHRAQRAPVVAEVEPAPERRRPESLATTTAAPAPVAVAVAPLQKPFADRGAQPFAASPAGEKAQKRQQGQQGHQGRQGQEKSGNGILLHVPDVPDVPAVPAVSFGPFPPSRIPRDETSRANPSADRQSSKREPAAPLLQPRVTVIERAPFPVRREEPPPAPTIQVTIGRIEVRATPAVKEPRRESPAPRPALDLEEYLRQRAKGDRR